MSGCLSLNRQILLHCSGIEAFMRGTAHLSPSKQNHLVRSGDQLLEVTYTSVYLAKTMKIPPVRISPAMTNRGRSLYMFERRSIESLLTLTLNGYYVRYIPNRSPAALCVLRTTTCCPRRSSENMGPSRTTLSCIHSKNNTLLTVLFAPFRELNPRHLCWYLQHITQYR